MKFIHGPCLFGRTTAIKHRGFDTLQSICSEGSTMLGLWPSNHDPKSPWIELDRSIGQSKPRRKHLSKTNETSFWPGAESAPKPEERAGEFLQMFGVMVGNLFF